MQYSNLISFGKIKQTENEIKIDSGLENTLRTAL